MTSYGDQFPYTAQSNFELLFTTFALVFIPFIFLSIKFQMNQIFALDERAVPRARRRENATGVRRQNRVTSIHSLASYLITARRICGTIKSATFNWLYSSSCFHC